MGNFLEPFSESFKLCLMLWPITCIFLTIPFIVARALARQRITWSYVFFSYSFLLYALGLGLFTLYPLPDNPIMFCLNHSIDFQLIPFSWIPILTSKYHLAIILQLIANIIFFIPLGIYIALYFKKTLKHAIIIGFLVSLLIEIAQLTGLFFIYPCNYRFFDVDDLIMNTFGSILGYSMSFRFKKYIKTESLDDEPVKNTLLNKFLTFCVDFAIIIFLSSITLTQGSRFIEDMYYYSLLVIFFWWIILVLIVPFLSKGYTLGRYLVGIKKNTNKINKDR